MANLLTLAERAARTWPDKIAWQDKDKSLTFSQLWMESLALAAYLGEKLPGCLNQPIAVESRRGVDTVVACVAALVSGNFYIPLDMDQPRLRVERMLDTASPAALLMAEPDPAAAGTVLSWSERRSPCPCPNIDPAGPAYAIFTSGSTGQPKCVVKSHGSMVSFVEAFTALFPLDERDVLANQSPFDLDIAAKDIYLGLACGARAIILEKELFSRPAELARVLNREGVTTLIWSASALSLLAGWKALDKADLPRLRQVFSSGEILPGPVVTYWQSRLPRISLVNLYAPTEVAGNCLYQVAERPADPSRPLALGQPFPPMEVSLRDAELRPVPQGEVGEICVSGPFLAQGYLGDPQRTAAAFLPHPEQPGAILYRTGDLARLEEGRLMFRGRRDGQVKHNGHRVELAEIEGAASALLPACCCLYDHQEKKICLCYEGGEDRRREIALFLAQRLPKYMLPNKYLALPTLARTRSGKPDRAALAQEYAHG